jgi:hypothetical protein
MKRIIYARMLLLVMTLQVFSGVPAFALTGGPSQPEFQAFEPIGTTEMVNLPDGGFTYNIPLMDIGGYPLNLAYHSEITADMEASCVGLGWTINPGVINRNVRALPDDFGGDVVTKEYNLKPNVTFGASADVSFEIFGFDAWKKAKQTSMNFGMSMGVFYNNYWGIGYEFGLAPSFSAGGKGNSVLTAEMGTSINSQSGANFNPSLKYSKTIKTKDERNSLGLKSSVSTQINSRSGMKAVYTSSSVTNNYLVDKNKNQQIDNQDETISGGVSASGSYTFAGPTFTPEFTMPQNNLSITVNYKPTGLELFGSNSTFEVSGYYSRQYLADKKVGKSAFGLLYAHHGKDNEHALMDFNREKDGVFSDYSIHLPIVNPGFDVLSVNGQGIGGSYQLKRGDVPVFFDAGSAASGHGGSLGLEVGSGNSAHIGVDLKYNYTSSVSKKWTQINDVINNYNFTGAAAEGYEPAYYKAAGEMAIESDPGFYQITGKDLAVRADLESHAGAPFKIGTKPQLRDKYGNYYDPKPLRSSAHRIERERRNQVLSWLTAGEARHAGLEKKIRSHPLNQFVNAPAVEEIRRDSAERRGHHISQIEAVQPGGMRYVYGIPAYNLIQKEASFSVNTAMGLDCNSGTVKYAPNSDNTPKNTRGQDNYFHSVETPAYAHSYLLTAVLSKDYEDLTGNGPTPDDFGSYTKINYSRIKDNSGSARYHWRVPFGEDEANFNPGFYSKSHDDKGSYIYGQKEIWLVYSIESKTMVAEFTYSNRDDGFGVEDENGGMAAQNFNKKLDKIILYSKPDRLKNKANATPVKTVHFVYDYSLCPGTDNSKAPQKGKLTLVRLYFTYGYSEKGSLSDYEFSYKNSGSNYSSRDYDRWGIFKKNALLPTGSVFCQNPGENDPVTNEEFPYAEQDKATADHNAGTWSLNRIKLPSGGAIAVDYQAKHYAYVQDKPAMRLMKIEGVEKINGAQLYSLTSGVFNNYLKVYFRLDDPAATNTREKLKRDYLRNIQLNKDYIYLKCYVRMNSPISGQEKWEYVSLYSQITGYGVESGKGFVVLKPLLNTDDNKNPQNFFVNHINPITKFALQFMRENLPEIAYDQNPVTENSLPIQLSTFTTLAKMWIPLAQLFHGFNNIMIGRGYAKEIDLNRSHIRLYDPDGIKYGGGAMVSKIEIHDNWGKMTNDSNADFSYGQEFDYTTTEMRSDGSTATISSGVASYEPMIGGDENPMRYPEVISEERKFAVDNVHYVEHPFGEVFMPAPQVVFGKITVRNLQYTDVKRTATGHTEMQYYTAKDFPVKTRQTDLQKMPKRIHPLLGLLKIKLKEHMNASQGYLIETNNMAGQAKSSEIFDENDTKLSGVYYHYKTKGPGELDNIVDVIHADGRVGKGLLGVNYQLAGDARESKSRTISGGIAMNLDAFMAGAIPISTAIPWPNFEQSEEQFRSMSFTKLVHKFGVLETVEAYDLGSTIATENLAYDAETGEVLLTRTYNEFNDPVYNLKLPAHFAYKGIQGAYRNIGFEATGTIGAGGVFALASTTAANFFLPGDEVLLDGKDKAWVLHVNAPTQRIYLIDINGRLVNSPATKIKIIRSGYRNMPSTQIGSITSMDNPIQNGGLTLNQSAKVLHAEAVEYGENWQSFCGPALNDADDNCFRKDIPINPFVRNVRGEWRPERSWLYLTERDRSQLTASSSTNIRDNGHYLNFSSFWELPVNNNPFWVKNETDWIWSAVTTQINPNGTELESQNRLGLYSAEILGYYNQLITGVAANSRYRQMAFEGFEDFNYNVALQSQVNCVIPRHFGEGFGNFVTDKTWHTGKYAIELAQKATAATRYEIWENCPPPKPGEPAQRARIPFILRDCECIQSFSPDPGQYVITAWVKEGNGLGKRFYDQHEIRIVANSGTVGRFKAEGAIIDGWQRIEGEFQLDKSDTFIQVELAALDKLTTVYFDDIRIFPFNGTMKNYVYDDISLKLLAELDANGYAKFYEYNQAGELIRVKQETERGIMTIQESTTSNPK